jgi:hypothetical protein
MHNNVRQTLETETNTRLEDYGDLIVQNIGAKWLYPTEDTGPGSDLPIQGTAADYDVMGDIDRYGADEAVLLAQKLRRLEFRLTNSDEDPSNVDFLYTFGFNDDVLLPSQQPDNKPSPNGIAGAVSEVNNDVLYHTAGTAKAVLEDSNGSASGQPIVAEDETNYLNEVGVLPEVSARENLYETIQVTSTTGSESLNELGLKLVTSWQLYWLETDEPLEGRQIDLLE